MEILAPQNANHDFRCVVSAEAFARRKFIRRGALELKLEDGFLMTAKPCNWVHLLLPFFTPYHYAENEKITILFIDIVWNRLLMTPNQFVPLMCGVSFPLTISASINGIGYFN